MYRAVPFLLSLVMLVEEGVCGGEGGRLVSPSPRLTPAGVHSVENRAGQDTICGAPEFESSQPPPLGRIPEYLSGASTLLKWETLEAGRISVYLITEDSKEILYVSQTEAGVTTQNVTLPTVRTGNAVLAWRLQTQSDYFWSCADVSVVSPTTLPLYSTTKLHGEYHGILNNLPSAVQLFVSGGTPFWVLLRDTNGGILWEYSADGGTAVSTIVRVPKAVHITVRCGEGDECDLKVDPVGPKVLEAAEMADLSLHSRVLKNSSVLLSWKLPLGLKSHQIERNGVPLEGNDGSSFSVDSPGVYSVRFFFEDVVIQSAEINTERGLHPRLAGVQGDIVQAAPLLEGAVTALQIMQGETQILHYDVVGGETAFLQTFASTTNAGRITLSVLVPSDTSPPICPTWETFQQIRSEDLIREASDPRFTRRTTELSGDSLGVNIPFGVYKKKRLAAGRYCVYLQTASSGRVSVWVKSGGRFDVLAGGYGAEGHGGVTEVTSHETLPDGGTDVLQIDFWAAKGAMSSAFRWYDIYAIPFTEGQVDPPLYTHPSQLESVASRRIFTYETHAKPWKRLTSLNVSSEAIFGVNTGICTAFQLVIAARVGGRDADDGDSYLLPSRSAVYAPVFLPKACYSFTAPPKVGGGGGGFATILLIPIIGSALLFLGAVWWCLRRRGGSEEERSSTTPAVQVHYVNHPHYDDGRWDASSSINSPLRSQAGSPVNCSVDDRVASLLSTHADQLLVEKHSRGAALPLFAPERSGLSTPLLNSAATSSDVQAASNHSTILQ